MSSFKTLDSIYNDIDKENVIIIGDVFDIHNMVSNVISNIIIRGRIAKFYEFIKENPVLFPYIIEICNESTNILDYSMILHMENDVGTEKFNEMREKLILDSISYTMNEEVICSNNNNLRRLYVKRNNKIQIIKEEELKVKIYQKLQDNLSMIIKTLTEIQDETDINKHFFRMFLDDCPFENVEVYTSNLNENMIKMHDYKVSLIANDFEDILNNLSQYNDYIKVTIERIYNLYVEYTTRFDSNSKIADIRNCLYNEYIYDKGKQFARINKGDANFYSSNYIVANINNERKFFIREELQDNNFYLRSIDKNHPFTIIDYIRGYFTGNTNIDINCDYYDLFNRIFKNSNYKDFMESDVFEELIFKTSGVFDTVTKIIFKTTKYYSNQMIKLIPITNLYDHNFNNMLHNNILWLFFNKLSMDINRSFIKFVSDYNDNSSKNHSIFAHTCKLLLNKDNKIIDDDNNLTILMQIGIDYKNKKKKKIKDLYLIISSDSKQDIKYYTLNQPMTNILVSLNNNSHSETYIEIANAIKDIFIKQKYKWYAYLESLDKFFEELIERFPKITANNINDFEIEFKYYYEFLNSNHPYLYTNREPTRW